MSVSGRVFAGARAVLLVAAVAGLAACGKKPLSETLAGTYATEAVQAELEDHERELLGDGLHAKFDAVDKAEAAAAGEVWARLRLERGGRFEYEGPAADRGASDAKLAGRWTARTGFVDLVVESASAGDAQAVAKSLACPADEKGVELPFLIDPKTGRAVRLAKR